MENKKTKLTISGNPKKSFKNFDSNKAKGNKTVVIDKKNRTSTKGVFNKNLDNRKPSTSFKRGSSFNTNFATKPQSAFSDFEKRKLAEQRATKRLKNDEDKDKKTKSGTKKREL